MIPRNRVLTALRLGQPDKVPWLEAFVDVAMQKRIMGSEEFSPADLADKLGLDGFWIDLYPPIFARREWRSGKEFVLDGLIRTPRDLEQMIFPNPDSPELYREIERTIACFRGEYAVALKIRLGAAGMLLSMGLDGFAYALRDYPGLVETVLGRYADWAIGVVGHARELGVDLVWSFDDLAYRVGPMISPRTFRAVILPGLRPVADAIRATRLPWIFHSDGNILPLLDDLLPLGMNAVHPWEPGATDIAAGKREYGSRVCLVGNIDLHYTLTQGTPEDVQREVRERIEIVGKGGGYIISSANSITDYCRLENVLAMRDAVWRYGWYSALE